MNYEKTKGQMQSFAFGEAMAAAAEDYKQARPRADHLHKLLLNTQLPATQPARQPPPRPSLFRATAGDDRQRARRRGGPLAPTGGHRGSAGRSGPGAAARGAAGGPAPGGREASHAAAQGPRCAPLPARRRRRPRSRVRCRCSLASPRAPPGLPCPATPPHPGIFFPAPRPAPRPAAAATAAATPFSFSISRRLLPGGGRGRVPGGLHPGAPPRVPLLPQGL